jgi:enoyl-CoA hydratase
MSDLILVDEPTNHVLILELNRPEAANALTSEMAKLLADKLKTPPPSTRCIILAGNGKHFCAGADLKERHGMDETAWVAQHTLFRGARDALLTCNVPVIAAVHGAAMGGGLELALASDFIYAAEDARFALTEATLGIMPGMGGSQTLPRAVGSRRAREILLTGKPFGAKEAMDWGMVNRLCAPETLRKEAIETASLIASNGPLSIQAIRKALREGDNLNLDQAFTIELSYYNTLLSTADRHEGMGAWNDKRKPVFKGK